MRKRLATITMALLLIASTLTLSGCGVKYCKVDDCSEEAAMDSKYCYHYHKCTNQSCKNKRVDGYVYCKKCLKKGQD